MESQSIPLADLAARASNLYERATRITHPEQADVLRACLDERARRTLRAWQEAFAPGNPDAFARRLSWDGFDAGRAMLAAAPIDPARHPGEVPAWTGWLPRIAATHAEARAEVAACAADIRACGLPFHEVLAPAVVAARREWARRCGAVPADLVSPSAILDLERRLAWELSFFSERALFELFSSGLPAQAGQAPGDSTHYDGFVQELLAQQLAPLFETFPVLARQWAIVAEAWVSASAEIVERLATDREALLALRAMPHDPGPVARIIPGLSDPHHGRRRVAVLLFESGDRIVYKPRSLAFDAAFQSLLRWLSNRGLDPAPRALAVLDRGTHGWVEHVSRADLATRAEVDRYYRQAGALLAIAWLLGGRDLHMENVVATSDGPVLVDLEMFLGPVRRGPQADASAPGQHDSGRLDQSVLSSGLLSFVETTEAGECYDVGGLQGGRRHATIRTRQWTGLGTDSLACAEDVPVARAPANVVMLAGEPQSPSDYAEAVVAGFEAACSVALEHGRQLAGDSGPLTACSHCATRFLLRPTEQYGRLLALLASPKYQRDGAAASAAWDAMLRGHARARVRPAVWALVEAERTALAGLDVPHFEVPCDGTSVGAAGSPLLPQPHAQSGLDAARMRIARLPETWERERSRLAAALRQTPATRFRTPLWNELPENDDRRAACIAAAEWIGRELLATTDAGLTAARPGADLYAGSAGPMLLFCALAAVTGKSEWRSVAERAIGQGLATGLDEQASGIGICSGPLSTAYALLVAGGLVDAPDASIAARRLARQATVERIAADEHLDVAAGCAGALLLFASLFSTTQDERWLASARACGERLLVTAVRDGDRLSWRAADGRRYVGFAHGSAGIGHALLRLHALTGEGRWRELWERSVAFERTALVGGNWLVTDPATDPLPPTSSMTAWCHGGAGIVLARAQALQLGQSSILEELGDGLRTIARLPAQRADHLCCGNFGRVEALFTSGRALDASPVVDAAFDIAAGRLRVARERGHFRLSAAPYEYRVFDPGFFQGLSGIGYQLLRLAAPGILPCVMMFDPPAPVRYDEARAAGDRAALH